MGEEEEKKKTEEEEGDPSTEIKKADGMIGAANAAAERLEKANNRNETLIARQEALKVERTLGGSAEAGYQPKEETPEEYAKKVMANEVEHETDKE